MLEKAWTIMAEMSMMCRFEGHKKLLTETVQCVVYVHNRLLKKISHKNECHMTLYQILIAKKPDLSNLRIFAPRKMF